MVKQPDLMFRTAEDGITYSLALKDAFGDLKRCPESVAIRQSSIRHCCGESEQVVFLGFYHCGYCQEH